MPRPDFSTYIKEKRCSKSTSKIKKLNYKSAASRNGKVDSNAEPSHATDPWNEISKSLAHLMVAESGERHSSTGAEMRRVQQDGIH